ncbi:MAG: DUF3387 domain-containing protein [Candidatus Omnitrophica bacterium]|nr:DUF3387 domain-containing protein [Candidatus Omnitrophota bacterium]
MVKRILRKYGYPPDKEKKATEIVLEQAALLCKDWTGDDAVVYKLEESSQGYLKAAEPES